MIHADQTNQPTCPKCGGHRFTLQVLQQIDVCFGEYDHDVEDGPRGDMEWGDSTDAICCDCGHSDTLGEMKPAADDAQG